MAKIDHNAKLAGVASLLGAALVTGSFGIWVRWVAPMLSTGAQTVARFLLAALLVLGIIFYQRYNARHGFDRLRLSRQRIVLVLLLGLGTCGLGVLYTASVQLIKVAGTMSLVSAGGIIAASLVGTVFLKERLTLGKVVAIGIALTGLFLYAGGLHLSVGILLGFLAGTCDGLCNCLRKLLRGADRLSIVMYQYAVAAVLTLPFMIGSGQQAVKTVSLGPIVALICFSLLSVSLGGLLLMGFSRLDANIGAVIMASQIFFAMLLGALLLHEYPAWHELLGGTMIFCASILAVASPGALRARLRRRQPAPAAEL